MGIFPPMNPEEWETAFLKYKQIPQFSVLNPSMDLSGFKLIFFWEYFHRLVGRLLGLIVFVPWVIFILTKKIDSSFAKKTGVVFLLGLAQGFLGWFMVSSGLANLVYVDHLRLTAHLMLALIILFYWSYLYFEWKSPRGVGPKAVTSSKTRFTLALVGILFFLQLCYGAIVAGLKAGYTYSTFPKMNGEWIPSLFFHLEPKWINWMNNGATTQFVHRWLALALMLATLVLIVVGKTERSHPSLVRKYYVFFSLLLVQFLLGVFTIVFHVPITIAVLHQLNACFLVIAFANIKQD